MGSSSLIGLLQEIGPCEVVQADPSHLKTSPREFGWDRASNLIFIDQPNQVGFSYDTATNGVLPLLDLNNRFIPNVSAPPGGGRHMYQPKDSGLQFFAESYGGHYGPVFSAYIEEQNERLAAGKLPPGIKELHLRSLGIVNGCVDELIQSPYYAIYGNHNPYNITAVSRNAADRALDNFFKPGGCRDRILKCRKLQQERDPLNVGDNELVNVACRKADEYCGATQLNIYFPAGRSVYDIAHADPDPFPPSFYLEFLNNATVQQAISAPVNFTQSNSYVYKAFGSTGDMPRGGEIEDLAYLLDRGVRVALIYGDRDYICNYMGGEAVSLAVNYSEAEQFAAAGYEDVQVNSTYIGGQVRQHGNFSFIRVFQAGHLVPAYQPETGFTIFERVIQGKSIATGQEIVTSGNGIYSSTGPKFSTIGLIPPPPPPPVCFIRSTNSCTKEQFAMLAAGQGVIINGVLYNSTDEYTGPGYVGTQVGSNASALGNYHTGSAGFPPPKQAPSGVSGDTVYPAHRDGSPLIPDNIDPERIVEKDETQEHGEPEDTKEEGGSDGEGRNYPQNIEVENFNIAPSLKL
ncbi:Alpha/Beta hydrolase protein [Terfezia claveryi]|nr:Alpha/Beta hydrolase protein [Terfezia claveryi]